MLVLCGWGAARAGAGAVLCTQGYPYHYPRPQSHTPTFFLLHHLLPQFGPPVHLPVGLLFPLSRLQILPIPAKRARHVTNEVELSKIE